MRWVAPSTQIALVSPAASDATCELLGLPSVEAVERLTGASHVGAAAAGSAQAKVSPRASSNVRQTPTTPLA